eukprot:1144236-Pelagomonas_calceolata.AAC.3
MDGGEREDQAALGPDVPKQVESAPALVPTKTTQCAQNPKACIARWARHRGVQQRPAGVAG